MLEEYKSFFEYIYPECNIKHDSYKSELCQWRIISISDETIKTFANPPDILNSVLIIYVGVVQSWGIGSKTSESASEREVVD